jgi:hypothetical protein
VQVVNRSQAIAAWGGNFANHPWQIFIDPQLSERNGEDVRCECKAEIREPMRFCNYLKSKKKLFFVNALRRQYEQCIANLLNIGAGRHVREVFSPLGQKGAIDNHAAAIDNYQINLAPALAPKEMQ